MRPPESDPLEEIKDVDEAFLNRWSRMKRQADEEAEPPAVPEVSTQEQDADEIPLTDADMPALETLTAESDYSGFLSPGVSEGLRRMALNKLFHGGEFNLRDGLDEYDEDYTQFAKLGDWVTADMKHRLEREDANETEAANDAEDEKLRADDLETADNDPGSMTREGQESGLPDEPETPADEAEEDEHDVS